MSSATSSTPANATAEPPQLLRALGLWEASSIVIGIMIGTAIFIVPAEITREVGSSHAALAVWIVGGLLSLMGALSFAELAAADRWQPALMGLHGEQVDDLLHHLPGIEFDLLQFDLAGIRCLERCDVGQLRDRRITRAPELYVVGVHRRELRQCLLPPLRPEQMKS